MFENSLKSIRTNLTSFIAIYTVSCKLLVCYNCCTTGNLCCIYPVDRLVPPLRENVVAGCNSWTNNGCESINNQLKLAVNWRPNKLPELITKLQKLVESQYVDADRAILGQGNYTLKPDLVRFRVTVVDWRQMSTGQQNKLKDSCFRLPSCRNAVTSTDGTLTVTQAANGGRKPAQRKRKAAERTTTPKRLRKY